MNLLCGILFSIICFASCARPSTDDRPNIIVILSDDMGYSDIGAYGGEIHTPKLDELARNGLRFTQFYNTGRCCPTRASLLTGLYPHQTGIGHMMGDQQLEGYRGDLNNHCVTIAEVLKPAGYSCYITGKWHITPSPELNISPSKHNWPLQRGFDRYYGIINGASSFWDPNSLVRDNQQITIHNDPDYHPKESYHLTDAISDNAVKFIREHDMSNPFFLYVAYTAAHWPMHARERDIDKYRGFYDLGYQAIRDKRFSQLKGMGLIDATCQLSDTAGQWDTIANKTLESSLMSTYAAMVDQMDQGIGRLLQSLKDKGQYENTLLLFLQDNGACAENLSWMDLSSQGPRALAPVYAPIPPDSIHYSDSAPRQTRDGWPVLFGNVMPGPADTYLSYNGAWANVSNTPFREYKHYVHEGGISTPLIVHWPKGFVAKNELCKTPAHLIDIMATCIDVAGASYPLSRNNESIHPCEGKSLVPLFHNQNIDRDFLFWEHEGNRALRMDNWKIVSKGIDGQWQLYDMDTDRSELNDLSDNYPDRLNEMISIWEEEAIRLKVYPKP